MAISLMKMKEEKEHILRMLPVLLKKDRNFRREVSIVLSDFLSTKDDLNRILEEIRLSREETNRRFEEINLRFEEINLRFEEINRRFEEINLRFEKMEAENNRRFEEINRRFEEINLRFEKMEAENNRRFEAVDRRFEAVDRRFEAVDRRFEAVDRRFEEVLLAIKVSAQQVTKELEAKLNTIGSRWGIMAEDTLRVGFESVLSELGFKVEKWRKKDKSKEVFLCARDVEIDILIKDGKTIALEMKSSLTMGEVENFERSVRFYEKIEKKPVDERIIVAIYPYPNVKEYARELGIKLLSKPDEIE